MVGGATLGSMCMEKTGLTGLWPSWSAELGEYGDFQRAWHQFPCSGITVPQCSSLSLCLDLIYPYFLFTFLKQSSSASVSNPNLALDPGSHIQTLIGVSYKHRATYIGSPYFDSSKHHQLLRNHLLPGYLITVLFCLPEPDPMLGFFFSFSFLQAADTSEKVETDL